MSQFSFLQAEFGSVYDLALKAEKMARSDPRGCCFYARLALESAVKWMYDHDGSLRRPYDTTLAALIHDGGFRELTGEGLAAKAHLIKDLGNRAVHDTRVVAPQNAIVALRELFHFTFWLVRTYARGEKPAAGLSFRQDLLQEQVQIAVSTMAKIRTVLEQRAADEKALNDERAARIKSEEDRAALDEQIRTLQAEIAGIKAANQAVPDSHDYNEAETRDAFIDLLLAEAGWPLDQKRDREYPVTGMPTQSGNGFTDYVLWGDDGKPLAVVEAKRTRRDPREGKQQAKIYADCLEAKFGVRPLIFYTNGYEHWMWDDQNYPPRQVQGFLKKDELELWRLRKGTRKALAETSIDEDIAGRYYQTRAIRRIDEVFETDKLRRALLVMATGSGKTRTVIALADQLMRANWAKRVLFLADRVALVRQAKKAFTEHLPSAPSANLIEKHDPKKNDHNGARICIATYPTMMNLIDEMQNGQRRYGVGHFDLIVVDEAHRSIYRKYKAIFDYFDAFLVGLTATPRNEIDHDTYHLFGLESGVPTDVYDLDPAVDDKYLVPAKPVSVPLKFVREGIKYDELSDEDKEKWDMLEWEGNLPDGDIDPGAVNKWLFNEDTVDKVLKHLMTHGLKVAEGDRLGKTIIFAKNHRHAEYIAERFDANYPHLAGHFARVIDFSTEHAQSLIDAFSIADKEPHIAISVDMLDTGIDVPEIVNLVFFKIVRSKTKFWQMIGRGTRLCENLFGPGMDKQNFRIFDYCQNFEFFNEHPDVSEAVVSPSLSEKLFATRVEIAWTLQQGNAGEGSGAKLNHDIREMLRAHVKAMAPHNFLVRAKRRYVERFADNTSWDTFSADDREILITHIAGLPTTIIDNDIAAKQFDYIVISGQLALLQNNPAFRRCRDKVVQLASRLETMSNIPLVAKQMATILEVQTEAYWQNIDAWGLEQMRRRLRALIKLIQGEESKIIYTNFSDELGEGVEVELPDSNVGTDKDRFQKKVRHFLKAHEDHITILKLRRNEQLTQQDLDELERIMIAETEATEDDMKSAKANGGLGLFVRSLVGMERDAAKSAFAEFLAGKNLNANQIEFIDLIIDDLTALGAVDPRRLYESPFTDIDDQGINGVFQLSDVQHIVRVLGDVRKRAAA